MEGEADLVAYDDDKEQEVAAEEKAADAPKEAAYVGVNASGFGDLLLREELLHAIQDHGFEHPSEVQHQCIPQAMLGMDIICQGKSGMGKTAVFILVTLQMMEAKEGETSVLVMCHTRELAYQIEKEYQLFTKHMPDVKVGVVYGGVPVKTQKAMLKTPPNVLVGTPGRVLGLLESKALKLDKLKMFVLDECDQMLDSADMRRDVQKIFISAPHDKQTMLFSATLKAETRVICKKFCQDPFEIYVDDESKLTLHGLLQFYIKLEEKEKTRKLTDLLDALEFNQVIIFVKSVQRAKTLSKLLVECNFPALCIHGGLNEKERRERFQAFKDFESRILITTNIFNRGIDLERVNIVINYDFPTEGDSYLHRVGRAGRFGTKGMAISFTSSEEDATMLQDVQSRFEGDIAELPDQIDINSYMTMEEETA